MSEVWSTSDASCYGEPSIAAGGLSVGASGKLDTDRTTGEAAPTLYAAKTELGQRLWSIRERMLAAGETTLEWDEIDREVEHGRHRYDESMQ